MENKNLFLEAKGVLINTMNVINQLTFEEYNLKIPLLGNSSIGEHTRHIIELFQQLITGYVINEIDYDNRKRNTLIQENIDYANDCISNIISTLEKPNKPLLLKGVVLGYDNSIASSYYRELLYNIEHCIHHQAIIKTGLLCLNKNFENKDFGIAKSTLIYKDKCAR